MLARRNAWLRDNSLHNGNKSMAQEYGGGKGGGSCPRKFRLLSRHAAQSRRGYYSLKRGCRLTAVANVATPPRDVLFSPLPSPSVRHTFIHLVLPRVSILLLFLLDQLYLLVRSIAPPTPLRIPLQPSHAIASIFLPRFRNACSSRLTLRKWERGGRKGRKTRLEHSIGIGMR